MSPTPAAAALSGQPVATSLGSGELCPTCGTPRGPGEFCEVCGYNFATGNLPVEVSPTLAPPPPAIIPPPAAPAPAVAAEPPPRWELRVTVDPAVPDAPAGLPERIFPLLNDEITIGRRSPKRQILPDVPLDADDGVSHRHASLRRHADGTSSWAVLDLGSANGTRLHDADLPPNVLTPLGADDTLRLGRWTVLTLRRL